LGGDGKAELDRIREEAKGKDKLEGVFNEA
jgi:hypothetical protein